ncbi:MAG: TIGR00266 family protein [Actinobacteria bacterium]|nr:TIGR00266 family protein [Actinomycetota bacterium]
MQVQTRQGPAYGVARLTLAPNEPVRVESGAMMAMSTDVTLSAKAEGGIMKSLKRAALGGESFFVSTYTAPPAGGFVDVAARLPGDITTYDVLPGRALFIQKGSWLANDVTINLDAKWGGFKNMFGGEGGFIVRADGQGTVVFACYGALEVWNLAAGQGITVDTGHMVAYEDSITMGMRKASGGGLVQSFKSGEGFVFDFTGPGRVWTQTRNPTELMTWISSFVGTGNSGSGLGGIAGGLLGRD